MLRVLPQKGGKWGERLSSVFIVGVSFYFTIVPKYKKLLIINIIFFRSHQGKSKQKSVAKPVAKLQKKPVKKCTIKKFVKTRAKTARKDVNDQKAAIEESSTNLDE